MSETFTGSACHAQLERWRTRILIGVEPSRELLAQPSLEVAQVGGRDRLVGEEREGRRVDRPLHGVEHPHAVRAGLGGLCRARMTSLTCRVGTRRW